MPEGLLQQLAAGRPCNAERFALAELVYAGDEREQQPAVRDLVELGKLLGEHERVTAERHDVGAEAQAGRAARQERDTEERIERRRDGKVGEPYAVEAGRLDRTREIQQR